MWEIIGKLITPQKGEVSPLILQLVVARLYGLFCAVPLVSGAIQWRALRLRETTSFFVS